MVDTYRNKKNPDDQFYYRLVYKDEKVVKLQIVDPLPENTLPEFNWIGQEKAIERKEFETDYIKLGRDS